MSSSSSDAIARPIRSELDVVAVSDLRMRYGTDDVLHGVSFSIRRGEVLVLLGPNGAGKTTTIEILEGFRMPSAGAVSVLGANPATADEAWRSRIGVVLQSWRDHAPAVFPLPHPSWRNTGWLKRNPWFEAELVPELRRTLAELL